MSILNTASAGGQVTLRMLKIYPMKLAPFPTPPNLIRQWQEGEIKREEMQRLMGEHQMELLKEADYFHTNPILGYIEGLRNKRAARRLVDEHGEAQVRELFQALSWLHDFEPAAFLWNADHWDVSLYAFLRTSTEPVFRVREMVVKSSRAVMLVEHGSAKKSKTRRERLTFKRHWKGEMEVVKREDV